MALIEKFMCFHDNDTKNNKKQIARAQRLLTEPSLNAEIETVFTDIDKKNMHESYQSVG